ncbi:unnamed protein product [Camellia sinensis]
MAMYMPSKDDEWRPPLFDGSNYACWQARMKTFLWSYRVWLWFEIGCGPPTVLDPSGKYNPRSCNDWDESDSENIGWNAKALNAIFCAVTPSVFWKISNCGTAKDAWDTLKVNYEETLCVKNLKLQALATKFEECRMRKSETFDEFYDRLSDIVNSRCNYGELISESEIVRKVLRSLPERFRFKVIAIEECKDICSMRIEDLVTSLRTYELNTFPPKSIGFKTVGEDDVTSSDDELSEEDLAKLFKEFKKFLKLKKGKNSTSSRKGENSRSNQIKSYKKSESGKGKKPQVIQCYECHSFGHIAKDCANKKRTKAKGKKVATWDDTESSEGEF